ncbi:MAG: hypothetical protein EB141_09030 [Verrucomicrobia bacterium]|nr:hypothetical protein [Verrucomicrobiota bacterium]NBU07660.1 hypothetical protein [Pseudomonadota bacterium]NDA65248.1 hypothetical protein [Verrucomicrobiota bacterium]NDB75771.1 hypothetical protein [Verrucomicrobiota bacterium]NDD36990.1 hypothetical protein [Verrucomicrobiota bacterium]
MSPTTTTPFMVNRRDLNRLFGSKTLAGQLIKAGWIKTVRQGKPGRESLYDYQSAIDAYERLKRGEEPEVHDDGGHNA